MRNEGDFCACAASDIVVVHNHPVGRSQPTGEDFKVTERIWEAAQLLGILFCDHIIIARDGYFSFSEEKKIVRKNVGSP